MKLLIITQKIDRDDAVLGFFHRWVMKLSRTAETVDVVCLQQGKTELPGNVTVWSLGKEQLPWRLSYIIRFFRYIIQLKHRYDCVFIHMNPVYVMLGVLFWRAWGKPVYLWYNHEYKSFFTSRAIALSKTAFHTSPAAFTASFPNSKRMPAGVDTGLFYKKAGLKVQQNSVLYVGRIAPIKQIKRLVSAVDFLNERGLPAELTLVGGVVDDNLQYMKTVQDTARTLTEKGRIHFYGPVPHESLSDIYCRHAVCVNLSPPGLFDKTVLEAMACETPVLVSSPSFADTLPARLIIENESCETLAQSIREILQLAEPERLAIGKQLRENVENKHSLDRLVEELAAVMQCTCCEKESS